MRHAAPLLAFAQLFAASLLGTTPAKPAVLQLTGRADGSKPDILFLAPTLSGTPEACRKALRAAEPLGTTLPNATLTERDFRSGGPLPVLHAAGYRLIPVQGLGWVEACSKLEEMQKWRAASRDKDRIDFPPTCVLLAAYGNRHYDDTLAQMKREMGERGFRCVGAAAVITPHIFAPTLGVGRPDEADCAALEVFARKVLEKLSQPEWAEAEVPGNPSPAPKPAVPVKKDRDWDICLGCGFCAKACPTGAMDPQTLLWDDGKCISCMSCVAHCPVGALGFNSSALAARLTENFSARREVETFV